MKLCFCVKLFGTGIKISDKGHFVSFSYKFQVIKGKAGMTTTLKKKKSQSKSSVEKIHKNISTSENQ